MIARRIRISLFAAAAGLVALAALTALDRAYAEIPSMPGILIPAAIIFAPALVTGALPRRWLRGWIAFLMLALVVAFYLCRDAVGPGAVGLYILLGCFLLVNAPVAVARLVSRRGGPD